MSAQEATRTCPHGVNVGPLDGYGRGPDALVTSSYCDICNRAWELRGHDGYVTEADIAKAEAERGKLREPCPECGCPGEQYDGHACEDYTCALVDPKPDQHGFLNCHRCERLAPPWVLSGDSCTSAAGLAARAAALVEYGNGLPDGVTTEAFAEAENLRRKAAAL